MKKIFTLVISLYSFVSCNNNKTLKNEAFSRDTLTSNVKREVNDSSNMKTVISAGNENDKNCLILLRELIAESSIQKKIPKDFNFVIDDLQNLLIQLKFQIIMRRGIKKQSLG